MLSSSSNQAIFFSETFYLKNHPTNTYLHSHFYTERIFHHCWSSCFHDYVLHRHSLKAFLYWQNLKVLISLKRHSFKVKHYIHKTYLRKMFILVYIPITKLQCSKKNYFDKFIEELDFAELSIQAKHLRVCILHND